MANQTKCSKCGGAMAEGFILDHGDHEYRRQQVWIEGAPEASFWSGIKTSNRDAYKVRAMRCSGCGFLEFYTGDKTGLDSIFGNFFT